MRFQGGDPGFGLWVGVGLVGRRWMGGNVG